MMLLPLSSKLTSNSLFLVTLQLIGFVQSRSFYGSPEEFMSMGDIDWGKRNIGSTLGKRNVGSALRTYRSPYKRYESPAWAYSSMADTDWGWKKRSSDEAAAAELYNIYRNKKLTDDYWKRYGQSYYQPYAYRPYNYEPEQPRSLAVAAPAAAPAPAPAPKTKSLKDRKYAFHSMADMDWGWKRKRSMAPLPLEDYDLTEPEDVDKKSLSSLHGKRTPENVNGVAE